MTTCERVRERLPEHVLGTLNEQDDATVRRHLRGCAGCRAEMSALGEGMASFARAVHDQPPPEELQDRVFAVLDEEWRAEEAAGADPPADPVLAGRRGRGGDRGVLAGVRPVPREQGSVGRRQRAQLRATPAHPRRRGVPRRRAPCGGCPPGGGQHRDLRLQRRSIVGRGVRPHVGTHRSRRSRRCMPPDGSTIDTWPVEIDRDGDGAGWLVTSVDLASFDRVTLTGPDGQPLAAGEIGEL